MPFADRAFVLVANRLIRPASEHRLAGWLETDFLCDRRGRRFVPNWHQHKRVRVHFQQLEAWYRTLDQLVAAKEKIEVALYHHLRDLFSFKPDLVLYDITSTYFEGAGPADFAKHGHSRDGKPHNVQVIVAVVMVAGCRSRIMSGPATRWTTPPSARPSPTCTSDSGSTAWSSSAIEVWSPVIISMRSLPGITAIWWA